MKDIKVCIIGLGYVGLPLAIEFSKKVCTVGYEVNLKRVDELNGFYDRTSEVDTKELKECLNDNLVVTNNISLIKNSNVYIITVPTPIDKNKIPDLSFLKTASELVGSVLSKNNVVIYESTTYPGCTDEFCIPLIEKSSKLKSNSDFFYGYSPERINPGDKTNTLKSIVKVTSGSNKKTANFVDDLYNMIITAGTFKASSIKVAEASKSIENAQRDLNISFVNELALIFEKLEIDTMEVIEAASSKWNFLKFKPGLVGGHCIGVDLYYLTYKAKTVNYFPKIISSGRLVNESMGKNIVSSIIKLMIKKYSDKNSKALIMGITFKENCPDIRNTRVIDVYNELKGYGIIPSVYDPCANYDEVLDIYNIELLKDYDINDYEVLIFAVAHDEFIKLNVQTDDSKVIYDIRSIFPKSNSDKRL